MSALPPKADIRQRFEHVCFVPIPDIRMFPIEPFSRARLSLGGRAML